jgi:hypothetical protein
MIATPNTYDSKSVRQHCAPDPAIAHRGVRHLVGGYQQRAPIWMGVGRTTDQLRTTTAQLSASQRSTMITSDKWFTLDNRESPIWGQGVADANLASPTTRWRIVTPNPRSSGHRAILDKPQCQPLALGRCDEHRARRVCSELVRLREVRGVREGTDTGNLRDVSQSAIPQPHRLAVIWPSDVANWRQMLQGAAGCFCLVRAGLIVFHAWQRPPGFSTVSTAGILPMCHARRCVAMGESTRVPRTYAN